MLTIMLGANFFENRLIRFSLLGVAAILGLFYVRWIKAMRRQVYLRARICPQCEYDLTGNVSGRCPECGTTLIIARRA